VVALQPHAGRQREPERRLRLRQRLARGQAIRRGRRVLDRRRLRRAGVAAARERAEAGADQGERGARLHSYTAAQEENVTGRRGLSSSCRTSSTPRVLDSESLPLAWKV